MDISEQGFNLRDCYMYGDSPGDLPVLEAVEHVALRNRTQAQILDLADGRPFLYINVDPPAFGGLLALEPDILEITGIPQGVKVAIEGRLVIDIAGAGENSPSNRLRRNPPISMDYDLRDDFLLSPTRRTQNQKEQAKDSPSRFTNLYD